MSEIIVQGLSATVIGMGIVLFVLLLLMCVLYLFKYIAPKPAPVSNIEKYDLTPADTDKGASVMMPDLPLAPSGDEDELIAVISAAVAACMGEGTVIKSITPVTAAQKARGVSSAWNAAARRENHRGLY